MNKKSFTKKSGYHLQVSHWIFLLPNFLTKRDFKLKSSAIYSMNQAVKSVVNTMATNSDEYVMVQNLCAHAVDENVETSRAGKWPEFQKLLLKVGRILQYKKLR